MYCSKNLSQIHLNIEAFQSIDFLKLGCMLNSISDLSHCKNTATVKNFVNQHQLIFDRIFCPLNQGIEPANKPEREGGMVLVLYVPPLLPLNHSREQTVGSPKVNFADNRTKNYTCTHTNSEHRRSVIRADADLLDEASKSRSYGASLFSIYQLQDKSEVQIKLGMSPALK